VGNSLWKDLSQARLTDYITNKWLNEEKLQIKDKLKTNIP